MQAPIQYRKEKAVKAYADYFHLHMDSPMMVAVKAVTGSILAGYLPKDKNEIIRIYSEENVNGNFMKNLYEIDYNLLFFWINCTEQLQIEDLLYEMRLEKAILEKNINNLEIMLRQNNQ